MLSRISRSAVVGAVVDDHHAGARASEQPLDAVADRDLLVQRGHENTHVNAAAPSGEGVGA